jgi:hypothetical protein
MLIFNGSRPRQQTKKGAVMQVASTPRTNTEIQQNTLHKFGWDGVDTVAALEQTGTDTGQAERDALERNIAMSDSTTTSMRTPNWVTTEGEVGTWHERDAVEEAIPTLEGAQNVVMGTTASLPHPADHRAG